MSVSEQASPTAIAEVISSSITEMIAQCWQIEDKEGLPQVLKPRFGSFLRTDCDGGVSVFSVVHNVITGSPDNVHKPSALGLSREQLKVEQPHIFALLRTEVHAITVGYRQGKHIFQHLPPQPPEVHDFVHHATVSEIKALTGEFDFLRLLLNVTAVPSDELLAACIREAYQAREKEYRFLVAAGQALSHVLRSDYDRLVCVLRKIKPQDLE